MEVDDSLQQALRGKPVPENISVPVSQMGENLYTLLLQTVAILIPLRKEPEASGARTTCSRSQMFDAQSSAWQHSKFFSKPFKDEFSLSNFIQSIFQ